MSSVTIIIPVLNEETTIKSCLLSVYSLRPLPNEVIVVDGGSNDETLSIARAFNCKILNSPEKGRACQQDYAALKSKSELIIFLHADTIPHRHMVALVQKTLAKDEVVLGGFKSIMRGEKTRKVISFHNYIKTYYAPFLYNPYRTLFKGLKLLFGDQVIFCRKADYVKAGGFDLNQYVMEEAAFCLRMNKLGRITQLNDKVYSSDRRVVKWGVLKAHMLYILICTAWGFGFSSKNLAKLYPDIR